MKYPNAVDLLMTKYNELVNKMNELQTERALYVDDKTSLHYLDDKISRLARSTELIGNELKELRQL